MSPTSEIRLSLPWPDKRLSPNARVHWSRKSAATKSARKAAAWIAIEAMGRPVTWTAVRLEYLFYPPDNRRRDRDNLIASMKAATDGIADALGIDDSKFECSYKVGSSVKDGLVHVTISQIETEAERFARMEPVLFAGMRAPKRSAE